MVSGQADFKTQIDDSKKRKNINGHFVNETILSFKPQLILLDVMLGDMDGRQICQNLKKQAGTQVIPVIIISATHGSKHLLEASCGADDYISKPFDIDNLISRINLNLSKLN